MGAEEGDETVNEYAVEGKQTLGRINDSQRTGRPVDQLVRRFARRFGKSSAIPEATTAPADSASVVIES